MKNTLDDSHKRYLRKLRVGFLTILCLFIGGLAFSISKLTAAPDTGKHISEKTVKGLILSPEKKPIPGAVINVKDTTTGTVTDVDGVFSMDLQYFEEETVILKISMIDYESTEVVVKTNKLPKDLGKITLQKETD
ncbi:carboxypeptidase-like regulatory domain-containing protein [Algoriphagus sp. D3-2-R+10]|uniref:carboxypeptidase-like regulatory domain-containing protein n=1 Tax=Algoriphagus aurantiacus TaxID=3103948 RepID=UPI002B376679|nr:carboxypeptidase-like regulatory domain-containing protein [Algoriphagus sp. D3-2-R+10]MEB2776695.1 carboxypeptidase-like regulatory domain-containing protein [Algoriphagus sp. D3-2-R+10]